MRHALLTPENNVSTGAKCSVVYKNTSLIQQFSQALKVVQRLDPIPDSPGQPCSKCTGPNEQQPLSVIQSATAAITVGLPSPPSRINKRGISMTEREDDEAEHRTKRKRALVPLAYTKINRDRRYKTSSAT
ncbi:hypothetical protein K469DRAFT_700484 [Zopfia rhizophila CBS 207.26]|uniref:Uncharacterized protein n=1 Tax=Zopfia rhizophila CBS 207.26 TaxID=1314779 RepID=A0A6A6DER7_9PEZI|nr:hypothetical protein K469DRAFT_700484 [Zopfia rhizophila CBS 207.26]